MSRPTTSGGHAALERDEPMESAVSDEGRLRSMAQSARVRTLTSRGAQHPARRLGEGMVARKAKLAKSRAWAHIAIENITRKDDAGARPEIAPTPRFREAMQPS